MNPSSVRGATAPAIVLCLLMVAPTAGAQPPGPPRLSPMSTIEQVVGVCKVSITYSRPAVRGRAIWGELVPWDEVWRLGANEATTIRFSDDVKINGEALAAGSYALFAIPSPETWTLIFNREAEQWGAFDYDQAEDALRIGVRPREVEHQEHFTIDFHEVGADSVTVRLRWETVMVPFEASFDARRAAIRKAREFVAAATPADGRMVWNWADYFYRNDFNTAEALEWATALAQAAPMYWTYALEARLLARNGRSEEALRSAEKALERAAQEKEQPGVEADSATLTGEMTAWREQG